MKTRTEFAPEDLVEFEPEAKVGLIATLDPAGRPHVTLISSIRAKTTAELTWGQFSEGLSKKNVLGNPRAGFLVLTMDKKMWRGKAKWTHLAKRGDDYEMYNNTPMFRYNAYFGIHTVHYMDLVETFGRESLPLKTIVASSLLTMLTRVGGGAGAGERILKPWAEGLFNRLDSLKFLARVDADGFPVIVPLLQCQAPDSRGLAFSPWAYQRELAVLTPGEEVAVFGLTMKMEDVLVRGVFRGFTRRRGIKVGLVDINWVYNSMPPRQGQIYPPLDLRPVEVF
ncbi:MAG: pyridoxamine 5'-phosphate oxidase family protein [Pseudomonadota bacterium]